jgi:hypothetical protein
MLLHVVVYPNDKKKSCLIDYLRLYVPLKKFSLIWRRHHCRWRAAKFRPMLGAQGLWPGKDLYRSTPAVTRGLGFSGLIRRKAPFSRGCWGPIVPRTLTGFMNRLKRVFHLRVYHNIGSSCIRQVKLCLQYCTFHLNIFYCHLDKTSDTESFQHCFDNPLSEKNMSVKNGVKVRESMVQS